MPDVDWFCQSCTRAKEKNRTKQLDEGSKPASAAAAGGAAAKAPAKRKAPAAKGGAKKSKVNPASEEDSE